MGIFSGLKRRAIDKEFWKFWSQAPDYMRDAFKESVGIDVKTEISKETANTIPGFGKLRYKAVNYRRGQVGEKRVSGSEALRKEAKIKKYIGKKQSFEKEFIEAGGRGREEFIAILKQQVVQEVVSKFADKRTTPVQRKEMESNITRMVNQGKVIDILSDMVADQNIGGIYANNTIKNISEGLYNSISGIVHNNLQPARFKKFVDERGFGGGLEDFNLFKAQGREGVTKDFLSEIAGEVGLISQLNEYINFNIADKYLGKINEFLEKVSDGNHKDRLTNYAEQLAEQSQRARVNFDNVKYDMVTTVIDNINPDSGRHTKEYNNLFDNISSIVSTIGQRFNVESAHDRSVVTDSIIESAENKVSKLLKGSVDKINSAITGDVEKGIRNQVQQVQQQSFGRG